MNQFDHLYMYNYGDNQIDRIDHFLIFEKKQIEYANAYFKVF